MLAWKVPSLRHWSSTAVADSIRDFPMCMMLRVPLVQRYGLLRYLSTWDIYRLEQGGFLEGLDDEEDVAEVFNARHKMTGLHFTQTYDRKPPQNKIVFCQSVSSKEAYFLSIWEAMESLVTDATYQRADDLTKLLFSNSVDKDYSRHTPRALRTKLEMLRVELEKLSHAAIKHRLAADRKANTIARHYAREVLNLILESGYRPSHITYNSMMAFLETKQDFALLEKLLVKITAIATTSEGMKKKWFKVLLGNPIRTLKLGISSCDVLPDIYIAVQKAVERKRIEELVLYIEDKEIRFKDLCSILLTLSRRNKLSLLAITAFKFNLPRYKDQLDQFREFVSLLCVLLKERGFQYLRLCGVITFTAAKSLIATFLSTPCSSSQSLEIHGIYNDTDCGTFPESTLETLPSTNNFYQFKTLVIDSIDLDEAKRLQSLKYDSSDRMSRHDVEYFYGSINEWLFMLGNIKVGLLKLKDYGYNCREICIPHTACITKLTMLVFNRTGDSSQWQSPLFRTAFENHSVQELTWHSRNCCSFTEKPAPCCNFAEGLVTSIVRCVPGSSLKKLHITINNYLYSSEIISEMKAVFPQIEITCFADMWTFQRFKQGIIKQPIMDYM